MMIRIILFLVFITIQYGDSIAQVNRAEPGISDIYVKRFGSLMLTSGKFNLGIVRNNSIVSDTIHVYNAGSKPVAMTADKTPAYARLALSGFPVKPKGQGTIVLTFDARSFREFGFIMELFHLNTDDKEMPRKTIALAADVREYFPDQVKTDSLRMKARIPVSIHSFGRIKQGEKLKPAFKIFNDGKKTLSLHNARTNCHCLKVSFAKKEVLPGDSVIVYAEYDSAGKSGREQRKFSVFMNDPDFDEAKFEITGDVLK